MLTQAVSCPFSNPMYSFILNRGLLAPLLNALSKSVTISSYRPIFRLVLFQDQSPPPFSGRSHVSVFDWFAFFRLSPRMLVALHFVFFGRFFMNWDFFVRCARYFCVLGRRGCVYVLVVENYFWKFITSPVSFFNAQVSQPCIRKKTFYEIVCV
jgi:hypothetical protein